MPGPHVPPASTPVTSDSEILIASEILLTPYMHINAPRSAVNRFDVCIRAVAHIIRKSIRIREQKRLLYIMCS